MKSLRLVLFLFIKEKNKGIRGPSGASQERMPSQVINTNY
ncbi:hypothetical protein ACVW2L_002371 [Mucilaginibacter sp. HD30]